MTESAERQRRYRDRRAAAEDRQLWAPPVQGCSRRFDSDPVVVAARARARAAFELLDVFEGRHINEGAALAELAEATLVLFPFGRAKDDRR